MPKPQRQSLADRDASAISSEPPVAAVVTPTPSFSASDEAVDTVAAPTPATAPRAATRGRVGSYLVAVEFDAARGAFLSDWSLGGQEATFAGWIASALDDYATLSTTERASRRTPRAFQASPNDSGAKIRTFDVPVDVIARMRTAIAADHAVGEWPTESAWIADAIVTATERSRARAGGHLPTPPARLPGKLRRI